MLADPISEQKTNSLPSASNLAFVSATRDFKIQSFLFRALKIEFSCITFDHDEKCIFPFFFTVACGLFTRNNLFNEQCKFLIGYMRWISSVLLFL